MDELPIHYGDYDHGPIGSPCLPTISLRKEAILGSPVTCVSLPSPQVCLFAQGPYLQQVQLVSNADNNSTDHNDATNACCSGWMQTRCRLLVFENGGSIHGIRYSQNVENDDNSHINSTNSIDYAVVFGGSKLSLLKKRTNDVIDDPFQIVKITTSSLDSISTATTSMTLSDWIWDVRLLSTIKTPSKAPTSIEEHQPHLIMAVGLAHNEVEIYRFMKHCHHDNVVQSLLWRRIVGSTRCVTYSLSFNHQWHLMYKHSTTISSSSTKATRKHAADHDDITISSSSLVVAVGTASHDIIIWTALDEQESTNLCCTTTLEQQPDDDMTNMRCHKSHCLQGHEGVIHAVQFDTSNTLLASASDDRSVRLWKKLTTDLSGDGESNDIIWTMVWVGWGHSARVWRVHFCPSLHVLLSTAEDGTARVWSLETGKQQVELHVATCQSLWSIDVCESIAVLGGNDGTVALVDLKSHIPATNTNHKSIDQLFQTFVVPDDRNEQIVGIVDDMSENTGSTQTTKRKKAKMAGQVVFGIKFYPLSETNMDVKLLVATRSGSLMTLNLSAGGVGTWTLHDPWYHTSMLQSNGIDPARGCCLCLHNSIPLAVIGTTRGDMVLTHLSREADGTKDLEQYAVLSAHRFKSIQSVHWATKSLLLTFHVQGIIILWYLTELENTSLTRLAELAKSFVLDMGTKAVPLSFALNASMTALAVGDTRGSIALFQGQFNTSSCTTEESMKPTSTANRVHQKEHISGILFRSENRIVSVGNDGCLVESAIDNHGIIQKLMSIPVGNLTGINHVWAFRNAAEEERLVVGGYFGNTFVALDVTSGYELFRADTGGRQRTHDCFVVRDTKTKVLPYSCCLVVLSGQNDGRNEVMLQRKGAFNYLKPTLNFDLSCGLHGETIFDVSLLNGPTDLNTVVLLSGSEDCKSKLSFYENGQWKTSKLLTPQESCVRCIACSHRTHDSTALLAVGGGKLTIQFFSLEIGERSLDNAVVRFLGRGRAGNTATIDHRINTIKSIPLTNKDSCCSHLVVTGDSEGNVFSYVISDDASHQSSFSGQLICSLSRPVLSIEIAAVPFSTFLVAGTTSGDITIFTLSQDGLDGVRHKKLCEYKAHQMGINCIAASVLRQSDSEATLLICSGGDDQAIAVCAARFAIDSADGVQLKDLRVRVTKEASASAIKGVRLIGASRLVSVGYSQRLALWEVSQQSLELTLLDRIMVDIGDVNSMGHCSLLDETTGKAKEVIAVCGAGVELFAA
jgi:WD40 repeat protein